MARLGTYEYPDVGLLESIELGKKIAREFAGEVSRHGLARSLGMAERGGAFAARIGALRMWGIASGRSRLRLTREGLRAVNPLSPQESEAAKRTLASQVGLFTEMASRMSGGPYDHARLAVLVEEITGEDRPTVATKISGLDKVFSEARPYVQKRTPSSSSGSSNSASAVGETGVGSSKNDFSAHMADEPDFEDVEAARAGAAPQGGAQGQHARAAASAVADIPRIEISLPDGQLSLPESVSNIDAALTVLWARRQLLAAVDAQKGKPTPRPPKEFSGA